MLTQTLATVSPVFRRWPSWHPATGGRSAAGEINEIDRTCTILYEKTLLVLVARSRRNLLPVVRHENDKKPLAPLVGSLRTNASSYSTPPLLRREFRSNVGLRLSKLRALQPGLRRAWCSTAPSKPSPATTRCCVCHGLKGGTLVAQYRSQGIVCRALPGRLANIDAGRRLTRKPHRSLK